MTTANDGRRYSAFVSYRHHAVDRFHAIKLMRALEAFSTPLSLRKQGYPAKLDPVFRDDDEAGAHGSLSAQLQAALTASQNLIVICSPRTNDSEWVQREIDFFKQLGRGDRIIPVVIDGNPSQVVPQSLRDNASGWESGEVLAVDLRPQDGEPPETTLRRGVLRIAAAALECKYDDLAQRAETERRRNRFRLGMIAGVATSLAVIGAFFVWDATWRIKDSYYANYTAHWGVPVGIGHLSDDDIQHRHSSTRVSTQAGRVIAMTTVNGSGAPVAESSTDILEPWSANVARWTYAYRGDGSLANATAYDPQDLEIRRLTYEFSQDRSEAVFRIENGVGRAELFSGNAASQDFGGDNTQPSSGVNVQHSNVGQHRLTFDNSGLAVREIFEPLQGGAPVADANGIAGRAFGYDHDGNLSEIRNLGLDGRPDQTAGKPVLIAFSYDVRGEPLSVEFHAANGVLVANATGSARSTSARDRYGNETERRYFDANGAPVAQGDWGPARLTMRYDQHGNMSELDAFGADGRPANIGDQRAAIIRLQYDDHGQPTKMATFGADSNPVATHDDAGVAVLQRRYDRLGRVVEISGLGVDGHPAPLGNTGAIVLRFSYDAHGNPVTREFFDSDGHRAFDQTAGIAIDRLTFDDQRRVVSERFYGIDGALIASLAGVLGDDTTYDTRGNAAQVTHVGADGRPQTNLNGTAIERYTYDDSGRLTEVSFFGASNAPVFDTHNRAAIIRFTYDPAGRLTEQSYFGIAGEPVFGPQSVHARRFEYDTAGTVIRTTDVDVSGNMLGFTSNRNDGRGRPIEMSAWLGNYAPAAADQLNGAHMTRSVYDQHGQPTSVSFFDMSNALAPNNDGVAQQRQTFDDRGQLVAIVNLNVYGVPTESSSHGAVEQYQYDAAGRRVSTTYLDAANGVSAIEHFTRDIAGHVIQDAVYDARGAPTEINGLSMERFQYNVQGKCLSATGYDAQRRQINSRTFASNDSCAH